MRPPRAIIPQLDCLYCQERYNDFALLSAHVIVEHNPQGYLINSTEFERATMKLNQQVLTKNQQLTPGMIGNLGTIATIAGVREAGKDYQFSDFLIDCTFEGSRTTYEFPCKGINEDFMARVLGLETDDWKGKKLQFHIEEYTSKQGKVSDILRFELANAKAPKTGK